MAKTKFKVVKVILTRNEGPVDSCKKHEFSTIEEANRQLYTNSLTAPKGGAYDKHDFIVVFSDGNKYSGRYDLHYGEYGNILSQMITFLTNILSREEYKALRKNFSSKEISSARKLLRNLLTLQKAK